MKLRDFLECADGIVKVVAIAYDLQHTGSDLND